MHQLIVYLFNLVSLAEELPKYKIYWGFDKQSV